VFDVNFDSFTPESLDDTVGKVNRDNLQEELVNLNQAILKAAKDQGIDVTTLPVIQAVRRMDNTESRGGLPTQDTVVLEVVSQPSQDRPLVLTSLVNEEGEEVGVVVSLLVVNGTAWGEETSKMAVVNIVFDRELLDKIGATGTTISREDRDFTKLADVLVREVGVPQEKINSLVFSLLNGPEKEGNTMMGDYDDGGRIEISEHRKDWSETLDALDRAAGGGYLLAIDVLLK